MLSFISVLFILISCSYNIFVASGSYCLFLICLSVCSGGILYLLTCSFWYSCILLLIYIGGVYVLLLFVSIYSYNSYSYSSSLIILPCIIFIYFIVDSDALSLLYSNSYSSNEESLGLISSNNWSSYLFILLLILLSMVLFSFVFSDNSNYIR